MPDVWDKAREIAKRLEERDELVERRVHAAAELESLLGWLEHKADVEDSHDWLDDEAADLAINGVRYVIEEVQRRLKHFGRLPLAARAGCIVGPRCTHCDKSVDACECKCSCGASIWQCNGH